MITIGVIIISLLRTYKLFCRLGAKSDCMNRDTHFKAQCRFFFSFFRSVGRVDVVIANK